MSPVVSCTNQSGQSTPVHIEPSYDRAFDGNPSHSLPAQTSYPLQAQTLISRKQQLGAMLATAALKDAPHRSLSTPTLPPWTVASFVQNEAGPSQP